MKFVRQEFGDKFTIAVAGSPEGHISCRSLEADISFLKQKQDNGADYIMTQLCWDMDQFRYWLDAIRAAGIWLPVDVGIMPILDQASTINMALSRNGCVMPRALCEIISKNWIFPNPFSVGLKTAKGDEACFDADVEGKKQSFKEAGIEYTINQIDEYRACRINGHPSVRTEQVRRCGPDRQGSRPAGPDLTIQHRKHLRPPFGAVEVYSGFSKGVGSLWQHPIPLRSPVKAA